MESTTAIYLFMAVLFLYLFLGEYLPTVSMKYIRIKRYNVDRLCISRGSLQTILLNMNRL